MIEKQLAPLNKLFLFDRDSKELICPIVDKYKYKLGINIAILAQGNYKAGVALYLHRLIVPEDQRNKGLGTSFMTEFTKWCDDYKVILGTTPRAIGRTQEDQDSLIIFYKKFGFKHASDPTVNKYWNVLTGDYFRLPI